MPVDVRRHLTGRAELVGATLAFVTAGFQTRGFNRRRIESMLTTGYRRAFGEPRSDLLLSPREVALGSVAAGAALGAGYRVASRAVAAPSRALGGACGLALWGAGELAYRSIPGRRQTALLIQAPWRVLIFAGLGVVVGAIAERKPR